MAVVNLLWSFLIFFWLTWFTNGIFLADDQPIEKVFLRPELFDVMLTDLNHSMMLNISKNSFGFPYNSPTKEVPKFPIKGIVRQQPYGRNFVSVIISYKRKKIKTLMIADSGCPFVFLSEQTLREIGIVDTDAVDGVKVHGVSSTVFMSSNHFAEVNVLGAAFYSMNSLIVNTNYHLNMVLIRERLPEDDEEENEDLNVEL